VRVLTDDRRQEVLQFLTAAALWVEPAETVADCRDAKDNRYLELALAAGAGIIVSGDADLLVLDPWRGVGVLKAAHSWRTWRSGQLTGWANERVPSRPPVS